MFLKGSEIGQQAQLFGEGNAASKYSSILGSAVNKENGVDYD